ncbi:DUF4320 family protein [Lacrimispora saccharolytica]|uniref:DUF4320 family protein n=1 Tax=Lacrimispora saccharolytica (strain ATCC 35040 / DSM 2544 / NRCC 2533 / WM1) TaxID=610130 RepID=D9RAL2_LACSW|nr:DUF4320 family protein [Lacrimispora saccharolytica]ADL06059.1 conserved hypothetical protein [[Clostridium] saccharolyticum WM1]QRV19822.1 DUF4320 family protein [Lacrimispora saccharolytica]
MLRKVLKSKRGEGYLDVAVGILCLLLVVSFAVSLFPIFTTKQQLDIFAAEIVREAEIKGSTSVESRISDMREQTGLDPNIRWDCDYYSGRKVQLNGDIEVVLTDTVDIGFFIFGPFPIELQAKATGKSEVYYK